MADRTIKKISMGAGTWSLLTDCFDNPFLAAVTERKQGTGTAMVLKNVPVGVAEDMAAVMAGEADRFRAQPRGTGGYGRSRKCDALANKIRREIRELGGEAAESPGTISPKGLPMKAKSIKDVAAFGDKPAVIEPKLDGWRATIHVLELGADETPEVQIWIGGGRQNVAGHLPHIASWVASHVPAGTILDGEALVVTSGARPDDWGGIQGILGGNPKPPARHELASFAVFDCIALLGNDLRGEAYEVRRRYLEKLSYDDEGKVWLVPQLPPTEETYQHLIDHGYEGGVIKSLDGKYHSGRRPSSQGKLKAKATEDFTVTGFTEGGGDFKGYIGAVQFAGKTEGGIEVTGQCSGMNWKTRVDMTENPDAWIGHMIEVKHNGILGSKLRHPQFKRRRPDK